MDGRVRALADSKISEEARRVVADWPPLTAEQCAELRALGLFGGQRPAMGSVDRGELPFEVAERRFAQRRVGLVACGVYFIQRPDRFIKIGHSLDARTRLRNLASQAGLRLALVGFIRTDESELRAVEARHHEMFAVFRDIGEWFLPGRSLLEYVRKLTVPDGVEISALSV